MMIISVSARTSSPLKVSQVLTNTHILLLVIWFFKSSVWLLNLYAGVLAPACA